MTRLKGPNQVEMLTRVDKDIKNKSRAKLLLDSEKNNKMTMEQLVEKLLKGYIEDRFKVY